MPFSDRKASRARLRILLPTQGFQTAIIDDPPTTDVFAITVKKENESFPAHRNAWQMLSYSSTMMRVPSNGTCNLHTPRAFMQTWNKQSGREHVTKLKPIGYTTGWRIYRSVNFPENETHFCYTLLITSVSLITFSKVFLVGMLILLVMLMGQR